MAHLTQVEFNMIRELLGPAMSGRTKFGSYAQEAQDRQLQQMLNQMASSCDQKMETLLDLMQ